RRRPGGRLGRGRGRGAQARFRTLRRRAGRALAAHLRPDRCGTFGPDGLAGRPRLRPHVVRRGATVTRRYPRSRQSRTKLRNERCRRTEMARDQFQTFDPAEEPGAVAVARPAPKASPVDNASEPIGVVLEIAGSGSQIALDPQRLNDCMKDDDPSIALAGQVGSQVKIRTPGGWLLGSVRNQRQDRRAGGGILANIDFMGEGKEEKLTGKIHGFRRGVTRYPIPGALVYPATTEDLRQIYASDGRSAIQIGTVYPTSDIRAGLYVDAMLGKHFALL